MHTMTARMAKLCVTAFVLLWPLAASENLCTITTGAQATGCDISTIAKACKGKIPTVKGLIWSYVKSNEDLGEIEIDEVTIAQNQARHHCCSAKSAAASLVESALSTSLSSSLSSSSLLC